MRVLKISNNKSVMVDDDVYEWASKSRWFACGSGSKWYAARRVVNSEGKASTVYLHRLIVNAGPGNEVDHRDGNSLNNQSSNLRFVTHQENQQNVRAGYGEAGLRGVYRDRQKYRARAKVGGKMLSFGSFTTPADAAEAARKGRMSAMTHSDGR